MNPNPANRSSSQVLGVILVVLGGLFLLGQFMDFGRFIGNWGWPFFIILPGVLLLAWAFWGGKSVTGLAVPGSIVTMVGLILFFQNATNHFESWAYAWGLIIASVGIGRFIQGVLSDDETGKQQGWQTAIFGTLMFAGFAVFFELFIFNQNALARYLVPLALIAVGVFLLMRHRPQAPSQEIRYKEREPEPPTQS